MNYKDEIFFEQYFPYKNMNREDRNFYINLILHTKDVSNSEVLLNDNAPSKYDLYFLNLARVSYEKVVFEGGISNSSEIRMIDGEIIKVGNKFFINTFVYRFSDSLCEGSKEYYVKDEFVFKNDRVYRRSKYHENYFEDEIELFGEMELEEYLENKCNELKLKK